MLSHEEVLGGPSLHPTATTEHGHPITHGQLPPLRQTGYGRASTAQEQTSKSDRTSPPPFLTPQGPLTSTVCWRTEPAASSSCTRLGDHR
ncbi:hypothetical protein CIB84_008700 [Bambusicola thoracicus]|uniref:Uncharacterized protein n=1 Tax=Bambusicola thoracicus TaxID=9083 RepID=A0A2P4STY3_BAMTH|nr:hypothetical protein CIB84_008700 [Bambusicola thoracicus]